MVKKNYLQHKKYLVSLNPNSKVHFGDKKSENEKAIVTGIGKNH